MQTLKIPESKLVKNQKKEYGWKEFKINGDTFRIKAIVRHDDEYGNGHNSFLITGTIEEKRGNTFRDYCGGSIHEQISKHFPELKPFIKWHLCSTDEPLHYVANTIYHAKEGNMKSARDSAIWPEATQEQLKSKYELETRLPALMESFNKDVESLGLIY